MIALYFKTKLRDYSEINRGAETGETGSDLSRHYFLLKWNKYGSLLC
jgi:hypothetical protein